MYQKWTGMGRLTKDPEMRYAGETAVCKFTMACDKRMSKEAKEKAKADGKPTADFIDVVAFRKPAEIISEHFKKGDPIFVEGSLTIRSYEDSNGIRRRAAEIILDQFVFMPNGKKNGGIEEPPFPGGATESAAAPEFNEDDIPF